MSAYPSRLGPAALAMLALTIGASDPIARAQGARGRPPTRDAAPPVVGTAVITGVVRTDDATGRTVRRATVTARGSAVPTGRSVLTDDQGRFALSELPAGSYSVSVSKPGWPPGYYGTGRAPGRLISVADGERVTDLEIRLSPGSVITGRIVDQYGRPQAGVRVLPFVRRRTGGRSVLATAPGSGLLQQTDDRGVYRIFGLPPGEYVVGANTTSAARSSTRLTTDGEVRWAEQLAQGSLTGGVQAPPTGPTIGYAPVYYPGVTDPASATVIEISAGEERQGIDFPLQFEPTARVSGTIQMPAGLPARGVTLTMVRSDGIDGMTLLSGFLLNRATARPDGTFAFEGQHPGEYVVHARASSQPPARGRAAGAGRGVAPVLDLWADAQVSISGRDVDGVSLVMQPGVTVNGRVTFTGDALERPANLRSVSVRLMGADPGPVITFGTTGSTVEEDGSFAWHGVVPGRYVVAAGVPRASGATDVGWIPARATIGGQNALDEIIEIPPGGVPSDLVVEFKDQPASVSGIITDGAGRPVQDLVLVLFAADPARWIPVLMTRHLKTGRPDSSGRFTLAFLPPGDYLLAAVSESSQSDWQDPDYLAQVAEGAIRLSLAEGEKKQQDIKLAGGGV